METTIALAQTGLIAHLGRLAAVWRAGQHRPSLDERYGHSGRAGTQAVEGGLSRGICADREPACHGTFRLQRATFVFIVCLRGAGLSPCCGFAAIWMVLALCGLADLEQARIAALAGALGFTSIWSGFLIAGNHFAYWFCHQWAQSTHFQLVLWGIGTMVLLAIPQ